GQAHVENGQQHEQRASHRVEEKLDGGVDAPRAAPDANEEVHGHQRELPEDVEQEQVLRQEYAEHACLKQEHENVIGLDLVCDTRPGASNGQHGDEGGQQHHENAEAINAHVVLDIERIDPHRALDQLQARYAGIILEQHTQGEEEGDDRSTNGYLLDQVVRLSIERPEQQNQRHAYQGKEG